MAKLTGAKKKAFLERMAKGRKKAARGKAKRKAAKKKPNTSVRKAKKVIGKGFSKRVASDWAAAKKKARKKKTANPRPKKLTGAKKAAFLKRMAKGRKAAKRGNGKPRARNPKRRRNNEGEAEAMYQTFHGKAPGRIVEYDELVNFPHHFAEMGRLVELRIDLDSANRKFPFTSFGDCKVVCTPDGQNIYFVGGDQRINLADLDIGGEKDFIELGPCVYICYHTTKDFHDFAPIDYFHEFGEEDGVTPMLAYDRLNQKLFLMGGNYHVKREGIVN
jgi:hypothetical protein